MSKKLLIFAFTIIFCLFSSLSTSAQESQSELAKKIQEYQQKLSELAQQKKTLSSQIQYMTMMIDLTTLKIQETEDKIKNTKKEVDILTSRISGLDQSLDYLSKLLVKKIIAGYKNHAISLLDIILDSTNAYDLLSRVKYFKTVQENNQKLLLQVQETKLNFEEQKKLREAKVNELDLLERQLTDQKNDLDYQKTQKEILLTETQNDETRYQELLQQALAEFNAIQKAIATGSKVGPVKKGDPIALVGNSGAPYCSTGPHLHFEVRQNNNWVNAENYLSSKLVENQQDGGQITIGGGSWDWPLADPIILEQRFGKTPYSWRYTYSGGIHTGIDIWSRSSEVIKAPADGILYTSAQNCNGSNINIKYIDHGNGLISFYLHVQ